MCRCLKKIPHISNETFHKALAPTPYCMEARPSLWVSATGSEIKFTFEQYLCASLECAAASSSFHTSHKNFSQGVRSGSILYGGLSLSVSHQQCKQVYPGFSHQLCASILQNNNTNTTKSTITMKGFGKQHCKEVNPDFVCLHIINDK